jgi:sugar phosphate isomerase/epimerase
MIGRRELLIAAAASLLPAARQIPVALQLFSVRKQCEKDLPGTLAQVAGMGYQGVELAGYYGRSANDFRRLLVSQALPCCAAHVPYESLLGGRLQQTIEFQQELGNRTLIVPGLPESATRSRTAWVDAARQFTNIAAILRAHGMRIGYHNHAVEFEPLQGERPWDMFFRHTTSDVLIELDLGNAGYGGADPVAALKQFPGRVRFVHVKDYTASQPDLMVGQGEMNWREFFPASEKVAGTVWYVIEHDSNPDAHLTDIAECLKRFNASRQLRKHQRG